MAPKVLQPIVTSDDEKIYTNVQPEQQVHSSSNEEDEEVMPKKKTTKRESLENDESDKKPLFKRLFSEEAEIEILDCVLEFKVKKEVDPLTAPNELIKFIKKTVDVDADRSQMLRKVKSLKKRFENSKKIKKIGDPHGIKLFELSKKIWGDGVESNGGVEVGKDSKTETKRKANGAVFEEDEVRSRKKLKLDDFGNCAVLKEGMNLLDEEEKARMVEKWKKHSLEETELYLKRIDLLKELTHKILKAKKSA